MNFIIKKLKTNCVSRDVPLYEKNIFKNKREYKKCLKNTRIKN